MIYNFDAAALVKQGFQYAVVLRYDRSLAEPRGTLLSKHRSHEAANRSWNARRSDTTVVELLGVAQIQAEDAE